MSTAGSCHWNKRRWGQSWQRFALFALSNQCFELLLLLCFVLSSHTKPLPPKEFVYQSLNCVPSLLYSLLRSVWQRGGDWRAPALPLPFTGIRCYLFPKSITVTSQLWTSLYNVRLSLLLFFMMKLKPHSLKLFILRSSTLFPNMWVSILSSNGFARWKWV